jgi:hypothetical protein
LNFFYVGRSFDALAARVRTGVLFGRPPSRTGTSTATTAATIAAAGAAGPGNRARTPISMIIRITVAIPDRGDDPDRHDHRHEHHSDRPADHHPGRHD